MRYLCVLLLLMPLAGCVTETRIAGSNKTVVQNQASAEEAAKARVALGLRYLQSGDPGQAKYNLERAKNHAPQLGEVHYALAYFYQQVGEAELAERSYKEALYYAPDDGATMNNYGAFLCRQGRYEEAEQQFVAAVRQSGYIRVAEAYENAGLCALKSKSFKKARTYSEKSLSYNASRSGALITLAEANLELGDVRSASFYLKRYLRYHRMDLDSATLGYKIAYAQGSPTDQAHYAKILKSNYPQAYEDLVVEDVQ